MSFQFQIMSDLHLETPFPRPSYELFEIEPQAPFLALLGDIGYVTDDRLFSFFQTQLRQFELVLFLLGNHEPYGTSFHDARSRMEAFLKQIEETRDNAGLGRFVYLNRTRYDVSEGLTVLGCTLFSQIAPDQFDSVQFFVSDFSNIEGWSADDHCSAHRSDLNWLNDQVTEIARKEPFRNIVIFTHHSPTRLEQANHYKQLSNGSAQVNSAFVTDLSNNVCWTSPQVRLWAFGHTHFNSDFEDPRTGKKGVRKPERISSI